MSDFDIERDLGYAHCFCVCRDEFDYEITFDEEFTYAPRYESRRIVDGEYAIEADEADEKDREHN